MKKTLKKTVLLITFLLIISCNNQKKTKFVEVKISDTYKIELPIGFIKTNEGIWEVPNTSFNILSIQTSSEVFENLKKVIDDESKSQQNEYYFKNMIFKKTEEFNKNGFKGIISYYEKDNKGKGLGLVSLKSYIVIATVQDDISCIRFVSISLNKNINDDIKYSIKSLSKNKYESKVGKFDEVKAKSEGFQVFTDDNFIIKCEGKLAIDKLRMEDMKLSGHKNSKPYHVFVKGVDFNINISDLRGLFAGKSIDEINKYNNDDLLYYKKNFNDMGVKNKMDKFKKFDAIYYENTSDGKLTKAVYFHDKMKSYMLQVSSIKNTDKLFNEFINTFELMRK